MPIPATQPDLVDPRLLPQVAGRVRATIALVVILVFVAAGLIVIRLAFRSWRRLDERMRQPPRDRPDTPSAWEASAQRTLTPPDDDTDKDADDDDPPSAPDNKPA